MIKRDLGIDLIKIVSMFMVIVLHMLGHGGLLENFQFDNSMMLLNWGLEAICLPAVNLFVIATGYLLVDKEIKYKKLLPIHSNVLFYSLICFLLFASNKTSFGLFKAFTPILSREYWFITNYFILYIFSPYINVLVSKLNKKQFSNLIVISLTLFSIIPMFFFYADLNSIFGGGTGVLWFIILYLIGAFFKKVKIEIKNVYLLLIPFLNVGLFLILEFVKIYYSYELITKIQNYLMNYNSLNIILTACSYFLLMKKFKLNTERLDNIFCILSTCGLSVYLIHDNFYVREKIWSYLNISQYYQNSLLYIFLIVFIPISIYIVCILMEYFRKYLLNKIKLVIKRKE